MGAVFNPFGTAANVVVNAAKKFAGDEAEFSVIDVFNKIMEPFALFFFNPNLVNRVTVKGDAD